MPPDACALLTAEEIADARGADGVIALAKPAPQVSTSGALAQWRRVRAARLKLNEEASPPTVETVVGARLLGLTAPTFEVAQALAAKAIARLR